MTHPSFPPRLVDTADDSALRDALRAAKGETMDPSRAMRALTDYQATKSVGSPAGVARQAARWKWTLFAKVPASLALLCAFGAGWTAWSRANAPVATQATMTEPAAAAAPNAFAAEAVASDSAPARRAPEPEPEPTLRVEDLPAAPMNAEKRPPNAKSDSFHEELTLMESARTALAQDDAAVCIRALDRYERKFPHGMFAEEAPVMRLEALVARGDEEQARSLGTSLLAKNPDGPHASRIRSLLASTH